MLHNQRTSALLDSSQREQGFENSGPGPAGLALGFLRRHYLVIAVTTALTLAASVIVLKVAPPTYTAQVKVLLGNSKVPVVQPQSMLDDTAVVDMESQIEILKSKAIVTSTINQLNLADDPDFSGKAGWLHSAAKAIREILGIPPGPKIDPMDELVEEFQSRLSAGRIGTSNVIELSFSSNKAERAAAIANAVVKAYFDDQLKAKTDEHRTATAWLHDRLQELGNDALNAERAVNELKTKSNIVSADGKLIDEHQVTAISIRQTIFDEVRRLADIAKSDFEEAKQQQIEIEKQLAQAVSQSRNTTSAELSIRELETSAKGYRSLYESFLHRYMGSVQQGSFP